jgi:hypothetical protein
VTFSVPSMNTVLPHTMLRVMFTPSAHNVWVLAAVVVSNHIKDPSLVLPRFKINVNMCATLHTLFSPTLLPCESVRRRLMNEKIEARVALFPLLQAEADRQCVSRPIFIPLLRTSRRCTARGCPLLQHPQRHRDHLAVD